nr:MAG TPA: hypothetical protein [Caudoviricetes sp.]
MSGVRVSDRSPQKGCREYSAALCFLPYKPHGYAII